MTLASTENAFSTLGLPSILVEAAQRMNFTAPTEIQRLSIPIALSGRDLVASAQTGSGKTAAFCLPTISKLLADQDACALVLAPTRELATQINLVWNQLCSAASSPIRSALLIGGAAMGPQLDALRRGPRIVIATPGRLCDHLERGSISLGSVRIVILDEADRMLDMGFAAQLREVQTHLPADRQSMLFSATFPPEIQHLARHWLKNAERVAVAGENAPFQRLEQRTVEVGTAAEKNTTLLSELNSHQGRTLIFTATKHRTDKLAVLLKEQGHRATRIHGNRSQRQRDEAIDGFKRGRFQIMVATDIAARGLDISDLSQVINYDPPRCAEDYVHRIGRTARAGKSGVVLNLVTGAERKTMSSIQRRAERGQSTPAGELQRGSRGPRPGGNRQRQDFRKPRPNGERSFERSGERSFERSGERSFDRSGERGRTDSYRPRRDEYRPAGERNDRNDRFSRSDASAAPRRNEGYRERNVNDREWQPRARRSPPDGNNSPRAPQSGRPSRDRFRSRDR